MDREAGNQGTTTPEPHKIFHNPSYKHQQLDTYFYNHLSKKQLHHTRRNCSLAPDLLFFYKFIKGLVWVPRSTMSLSLMPNRYRWVIMILTCPIRRETLYRSSPFFSCICAKVWRQVWGLTRTEDETPTSSAACSSIRATASSVRGLPVLLRKRFLCQVAAFTVIQKFVPKLFQTHKKTPFLLRRTTKRRAKNS